MNFLRQRGVAFAFAAAIILTFNALTLIKYKNINSSSLHLPSADVELLLTNYCGEHLLKMLLERFSHKNGLQITSSLPRQFNGGKVSADPHKDGGKGLSKGGMRREAPLVQIEEEVEEYGLGVFAIHPPVGQNIRRSKSHRIAIVRDPYVQFANMWSLEKMAKFYKLPLHKFIHLEREKMEKLRKNNTFGLSQMTFDFGLDFSLSEYEFFFHVRQFLNHLDLVLVAERLEESLVLLKDVLNWGYEDVAPLYLNYTQLYYREGPIPVDLIEPAIAKLAQMNMADIKLYRMVSREMDAKVERYGRGRMEEHVKELRRSSEELQERCQRGGGAGGYDCTLVRPPEFDKLKSASDSKLLF